MTLENFEQNYVRESVRLVRSLSRLTKSQEDAKDFYHDTVYRLLKDGYFTEIENTEHYSRYVFWYARRLWLETMRKNRRENVCEIEDFNNVPDRLVTNVEYPDAIREKAARSRSDEFLSPRQSDGAVYGGVTIHTSNSITRNKDGNAYLIHKYEIYKNGTRQRSYTKLSEVYRDYYGATN